MDIIREQSEFRDEIAQQTKQMRLTDSTRRQYADRVRAFAHWLDEHYPACVERDNGDKLTPILPIPDVVMEKYMAHVLLKIDSRTGLYYDPPQYYSFAHVNGHRSALKNMYTEKRMNPSPEIESMFKETLEGFKRKVADLKQRGLLPSREGKAAMTMKGYIFLAEKAAKQDHDFGLYTFCLSYLLLCWNLIARSVTVAHIMYDHISWEEDALTINIGKQKNDQEGSNGFPRHIYANPKNPIICPILALSVWVFTQGYHREGSDRRLFGNPRSSQDRFEKWLSKVLKTFADAIISLGIMIAEIGTHSFRKGVATALANCPGGPSAINIWLRAGWSLGPVQSRYIFEGAGGDQFVGRAATGISSSDPDFAILPPHFDDTNGPVLSVEEWEDILPGFTSFYPENFRVALPYLLASLAYHHDWLLETLSPNHPLFLQRVWTSGILQRLRPKVLTGVFRNDVSRMNATGVPPNVILANRMSSLEANVGNLSRDMRGMQTTLPEALCTRMLDKFTVNGAVPITSTDIDSLRETLLEEIRTRCTPHNVEQISTQEEQSTSQEKPGFYTWGGHHHLFPEGFRFPKGNIKMLWDLWWGGEPQRHILPYRKIKGFDLSRTDRVNWSKCTCIMNALVSKGIEMNEIGAVEDISSLLPRQRDALFSKVFIPFCMNIFAVANPVLLDDIGIGKMSYTTFYDYMKGRKRNKRRRNEMEQTEEDN